MFLLNKSNIKQQAQCVFTFKENTEHQVKKSQMCFLVCLVVPIMLHKLELVGSRPSATRRPGGHVEACTESWLSALG